MEGGSNWLWSQCGQNTPNSLAGGRRDAVVSITLTGSWLFAPNKEVQLG